MSSHTERAHHERLDVEDVGPLALLPTGPDPDVGFTGGRERGPRRVEGFEGSLEILVYGVVLPDDVHVPHVRIGGEPWRIFMRHPHRDRRMVAQQLDRLGLDVARRRLEELCVVAAGLVGIGAEQGKLLDQEHAGRVGLAVEVSREHVGDHA
jgi:hypothetical protein